MKKFKALIFRIGILVFAFAFSINAHSKTTPSYKNSKLSVQERTSDLLSQMTLEEKVGELLCPLGWFMYERKDANHIDLITQKYKDEINQRHVGMYWAVFRADPWTQKTIETGLNPFLSAEVSNAMQAYAIEKSRLGIPVFIAEEAPHGHMAIGTTVFPVGIGLACSWNPELIEEVGKVISKEIRLQGAHISYGPVLDLSRDPRWSRMEESYGEDPYLMGQLGAAYVRGTGGGNLGLPYATIATLKHFIAYGIPEGGQNGNMASIGKRELLEQFLTPFSQAIKAGALSVMTAYNSIDGIPCSSNKYLLTNVLRGDLKFKGFVVSDLVSIDGLVGSHKTAESLEDAAVQALKAGVDVDLGTNAFSKLIEAVKMGNVEEAYIDRAVERVIRLKFEMGLFDNPFVDPKIAQKEVGSKEHISLANKAAEESIVLLKNNGILPLNKSIKKIAVIGPNANNIYNQLGDYTAPQEREKIITVLDGIRSKMPNAQVKYTKGCDIRDTTHSNIEEAANIAKWADVAVVVVGGSSARDFRTKYMETGAALVTEELISDIECGEGFDRSSLDLLGLQMDLLKAVKATGTPMVILYIEGRPLNMNWAAENGDALLTAWYPGQEGGNAIADILFGSVNPSGKLVVSIPRSVGQLPVYYNKKNPTGHKYVEESHQPLYAFGYGLSYTSFTYNNLKISQTSEGCYNVTFDVTNTGKVAGAEVCQLYTSRKVSSVVQPQKQLKNFKKIYLNVGEMQKVTMELGFDELKLLNEDFEYIIEKGVFEIEIGSSSDDIRLKSELTIPKNIKL